MIRVGIVGAGLIGEKRANALKALGDEVIVIADKNPLAAEKLAAKIQAETMERWEGLVQRPDLDAVIVATSNDAIPLIALNALEAGKHVFIEKPGGRYPEELRRLKKVSENSTGVLRVGFNHRFHPGLLRAYELVKAGAIGELMYLRARYGHGGRLGYDREWRANPNVAGGGELLDQGVHLIDLCRWFGGEFDLDFGRVGTFFWDMPVEDNGFLLLKSRHQKIAAQLHASCTEWKNLFDFEIFGRKGKLQVWGLGRSYGVEELRFFKMKPEMGPPDIETWKYEGEDLSWRLEWEAFHEEIRGNRTHLGTVTDALRTIEIVHAAYKQSGVPYGRE